MRRLAEQNTQRIVEDNQKLQSNIQGMMVELDAKNKQIEELVAKVQDKRNLELEMQKVSNFLSLSTIFYLPVLHNRLKLVSTV